MLARKMYRRTCFGRVQKLTCFARSDTNAGLKEVCTDEPVSAEFTRSPALPGLTKVLVRKKCVQMNLFQQSSQSHLLCQD